MGWLGNRGAVTLALMTMTAALVPVGAQAAPLPSPVVQQREVGPVLLAHRFETPDTTGLQRLTVVVKPNSTFTTQTLLDFDRDGVPDALVNIYPGASGPPWPGRPGA
jgi:hypothetical protein